MATPSRADLLTTYLNQHFQDVRSLRNVVTLKKENETRLMSIQSQLSLASTEIPSEISKAVQNVNSATTEITRLDNEIDHVQHSVSDHTHAVKPMVGELQDLVDKIRQVQRYLQYLSCVSKVEDLSAQIQASLVSESLKPAVESFRELIQLFIKVQSSSCQNLLNFIKNTISFWSKLLQDRIAVEFEEVLKALRWPLVISNMKAPSVTNVTELKNRMGRLFQKLLKLQLPDTIIMENAGMHPPLNISGIKPLILPLELMLKPLRKRFRYHFYGQKQTNSLEKPEWYLTQVLNWIQVHGDFLDRNIQPQLDEAGYGHINAKTEFNRGLVIMVMEKISSDVPELADDDANFSHLIDEVLLFDSELKNTYSYPPILPGCLDVLCLQDNLTKWLAVEKKFAMQKIEQMFQSPSAWESQYKGIKDSDEIKVPECAESVMTLLYTITDRYKKLPVSVAKLQFLGFQLELLEDFRMRLVQVMKDTAPTGILFSAVLNAVFYVQQVLRDCSEQMFFLQLLWYKNDRAKKTSLGEFFPPLRSPADDDSVVNIDWTTDLGKDHIPASCLEQTVFEEINSLFEGMQTDMIKTVCNYVFMDIQARSQAYRKDRWISLPSPKELSTNLGLSSSACEMFLVLKDHLTTMQGQLSETIFDQFWQSLAKRIDSFILNEVIFANHFNDGGALQLQFDVMRNMVPLFGDYTPNPESYFRMSKEAAILLTLKSGSAILLKELLYSHLHESLENQQLKHAQTDAESAMRDVGVFTLSADQCEKVLSLRTNLSIQ